MSDKVQALVDQLRDYKMSAEEIAEQRISFAYGNAPQDDKSTKDEVREAVTRATVPSKT